MIRLEQIEPKLPLDYNPYDEDCCGAYTGTRVILHCDTNERIKIEIRETRSGIGEDYGIWVTMPGRESKRIAAVFVDDDGDNQIELET